MSDDTIDDQAASLAALFLDENLKLAAGSLRGVANRQQQTVSRVNCGPLKMPKNFATVMPGVYRSHYPASENFTFLRVLGIKTILTLVPEDCPVAYQDFMTQYGIQHFQVPIEPNKDPAITINPASMEAALRVLATSINQPVLVHCNKGKHRTGCVVACLRKIIGWTHDQVLAEYRHHAGAKARALDERYIDTFDARPFQDLLRQDRLSAQNRLPLPRLVQEPFRESPVSKKAVSRLRG